MYQQLNKLFNQVKEYGKYTRINKLDGLLQWNILKGILLTSDVKGEWNSEVKTFFIDMRSDLKIQECESETENHDIWEKHHFYLQHARIPTLNFNDAKLVRLIQIAYNAGQLEALWHDNFYTQKMRDYYDNNNLGNIETYMSEENLIKINNSITDEMIEKLENIFSEQATKNYNNKYLKYKNKYLNLKNKQ